MNNLYKYISTACIILIMQAALAQQPALKPLKPAQPEKPMVPQAPKAAAPDMAKKPRVPNTPKPPMSDINCKVEKALKEAEKKIKETELQFKKLELNEKLLAAIDKSKLQDLKLKFKENLNLNDLNIEFNQPDYGINKNVPATLIEKNKEITKTYKVNSKDKLSIQNQFGRITVNTWTKNEIKVNIVIKAYDVSDSKAQELLDGVSIVENNKGNLISFKTQIQKEGSSGLWEVFKRKTSSDQRRGIEVFYTVYMPADNAIDITNLYGNVVLPDLKGPVNLNTTYSSLNAQNLENSANKININYGSATIKSLSGNLNISYGSLNLVNADKLNANIRYNSSAKINKLTNNANLEIRYTPSFKINEVDKDVDNLLINSSYSGITLVFDKAANYNFDVTVSYSGFKYDKKKTIITDKFPDEKHRGFVPTNSYKGYYGSGTKNSTIVIKSSYGAGVSFL